jgi:cobalt-zinc-cadmium efflux system outer membrane protein
MEFSKMERLISRAKCARLVWLPVLVLLPCVTSPPRARAQEAAPAAAAGPPAEREVTLAELLAHAERHAPAIEIAARRRGYAAAARADAGPRFHDNPVIELGVGPRFGAAEGRAVDFFAAVGQPVEIAGERGLRREAAARLGDRLEAEAAAAAWELRREVVLAYWAAVVAREGVVLAERLVRFADELRAIAQRRLAAGDIGAIDVRVAELDVAQARQAGLAAEQELRAARIWLCEVTGWPVERPPLVPLGLEAPRAVPALAEVLRAAGDRHPALRARRAATAEAGTRAALADREAWPTPVVGVQLAREGAAGSPASYILLGTLELPLPLWQRNQGERARARVDEEVARAEEDVAARLLRARIAHAHAELQSAAGRLALFTASVTPSLEDSLALLRRGFDAGEIPLLDIAVARERFLQAQRDALRAHADYHRARAELESAMGAELPAASASPRHPSPGGAP